MEINIQSLLWVYTAIISGQLASVSVTSKSIIKIPTEKNTNFFLSLYITLSFYSIYGILILNVITQGVVEGCILLILSFISYKILNKFISKINFPTFIDLLFYLWTLFIFFVLCGILLRLFNIE
jgi:hypothetical protein|tara:strand:+ start:115 stop:486 length:372 start_codon:yes stop_codon:yes gene_type:complete